MESTLPLTELREPQSRRAFDLREKYGLTPLGLHTNQTWYDDPKRLVFMLSRYKFVAKMLAGRRNVLEVGCGDGFGSRIVLDEIESLTAIDFEHHFVDDINARMDKKWQFKCLNHDITIGPVPDSFDAAYSLDVLEHIPKQEEDRFMQNICDSLIEQSVLIIGTPTLESQAYASENSKIGHVNCKGQGELRDLMERYFYNVFIFSMNDEVVHTGFYKTAHYLIALCCSKRML